jgi:hypothetical protein
MTDAGELRLLADDLEMDGYLGVPSRLREIADRLEALEDAIDTIEDLGRGPVDGEIATLMWEVAEKIIPSGKS